MGASRLSLLAMNSAQRPVALRPALEAVARKCRASAQSVDGSLLRPQERRSLRRSRHLRATASRAGRRATGRCASSSPASSSAMPPSPAALTTSWCRQAPLQALDLINGVLLARGDTVIIEQDCYQGTINRLKRLGVHAVGIPLDRRRSASMCWCRSWRR